MEEFKVIHGNLNLMVGGKLQKVAKGSTIKLSAEKAKGLIARGFIASVKESEAIDLEAKAEEAKAAKAKGKTDK